MQDQNERPIIEDEEDIVDKLLQERKQLKEKLAKKERYISELNDSYNYMLKVSTKENDLLVEKTKEIERLHMMLG